MCPGYQGMLDEGNESKKNDLEENDLGLRNHNPDLQKKITSRLKKHTELNAGHVKVLAFDGMVELHGHVDGRNALATIEALVRTIEGVTDVINFLKIDNGSTTGVPGIKIE